MPYWRDFFIFLWHNTLVNNESVKNFIQKVIETYSSGHAREHSYRPALKDLFESATGLKVINEPKRSEHGAPDFVFLKGKIVVAYAEAKDINVSLDDIEKSEQMDRYYGYSNIILTNGLEFRFYRNASQYADPIVIAELKNGNISPSESSFQLLGDTINDFIKESKEPIKSGSILAKVMAGKARRIRDNVKKFLADENNAKNENLLSVYEVIKKLLLADLDKNKFADMYAQTLVYGLFVARYYDKSQDDFSRQEARDLVPASNPFLRHFFDHIAGSSFDPRIEMIVNELCEEFTHADVQAIVHNYYKTDKDDSRDPIIHFYEDFLQEYDSAERKKMGVFYTPLPVVRFIVRSIDDILKKDFGLSQGLADVSKVEITREIQGKKKKDSVHKVQVLDPATGTGTFLNEAILHIKKSFAGQEGRWSQYVNSDLLPRLHGFELMMASYTIAHLKLSSTIKETGVNIITERLGVYLTNSLEKGESEERTLFSSIGLGKAITEESNQANKVKNKLPIMVVMGNPPYSGESSNAHYTENDVYKIEPSGGKLQERNSKWLNDDYVKFIRFAESLIEKTGEGIVAMITAHGYIDNPTFRGMRYRLMQTFDRIYILDLHGNANKKEKTPDGGKDENVFSIKQGVAIFIGVKRKEKTKKLSKISRADCFGLRQEKFDYLNANSLEKIDWKDIAPSAPNYEWVVRDIETQEEYRKGFSVAEIFPVSSVGIVTSRDDFVIDFDKDVLKRRITDFLSAENPKEALAKFGLKENLKWKAETALKHNFDEQNITPISYRPFDNRFVYCHDDFIERSRREVMKNFLKEDNVGLVTARSNKNPETDHFFVSKNITETKLGESSTQSAVFPLYVYAEDGSKVPNLKKEIVEEIEKVVGKVSPEDIFEYTYAVLNSPNYRKKYKEFLKIDFPRVPYPKDGKSFKELVSLGAELRSLHLLESSKLNQFITTYPVSGSNIVEKPEYKDGKVFINKDQYFGNVPEIAWNFYIGGYQPAQKWLKDRKGYALSNSDIEHYQKIIVALRETERIMKEIDFYC